MNLYVNIIEFWSRLNSEIHITVLYGIRADIIIDNVREFVYNQIEVHSTVYNEKSADTQGSFLFEMKRLINAGIYDIKRGSSKVGNR